MKVVNIMIIQNKYHMTVDQKSNNYQKLSKIDKTQRLGSPLMQNNDLSR